MNQWSPPETLPPRTPVRICLVDTWSDKARVSKGYLQYGHLWEIEYQPTAMDREKGILMAAQTVDGEYVRLVQSWEALLGWAPTHKPRKRPRITNLEFSIARTCRWMPIKEA